MDASEKTYVTAIYIKSEQEGEVETTERELLATVIGSRAIKFIAKELQGTAEKTIWCGSLCVEVSKWKGKRR